MGRRNGSDAGRGRKGNFSLLLSRGAAKEMRSRKKRGKDLRGKLKQRREAEGRKGGR